MTFLAQTPDISGVPADFVKNFMIMLGFALALWGGRVWGRRGRAEDPVHLHQPLVVQANDEVVRKSELALLKTDFENFRAENQAQHQAAALAGQQRVTALSEVLDEETSEIVERVEKLREGLTEKLDREFRLLHEKISQQGERVAAHNVEIPNIKERLEDLTERYNTSIPAIHRRIDDAVRIGSSH